VIATNTLRNNDTQIDISDPPFTTNVQVDLNATR